MAKEMYQAVVLKSWTYHLPPCQAVEQEHLFDPLLHGKCDVAGADQCVVST